MFELEDLLVKKSNDYGPEPIYNFGLKGISIRIDSKLARLKNLLRPGHVRTVTDEVIRDTWMDILGYVILGMLFIEGEL
jgi:hypothetical protein